MPRPNHTFALLTSLGLTLLAAIGWSAHHFLEAGAPALAEVGGVATVSCLLLPVAGDLAPHLGSYVFLAAIGAGTASGLRALARQHRQTRGLLQACHATGAGRHRGLARRAWRLGLSGRLDVVELAAPVAFCYGLLRPRILVSSGLADALAPGELDALLLHEREHLRQRDPLKVALGKLLVSAGFFVPALGAIYRRYLVEKELAADGAAIAAQGDAGALAGALVRLLEEGGAPAPALGASASDALEARIDALVGEPLSLGLQLGWRSAATSVVVLLLVALPLVRPPAPVSAVGSSSVASCHLAG